MLETLVVCTQPVHQNEDGFNYPTVMASEAIDLGWRLVLHPWACMFANHQEWLCPECVGRFKEYLAKELTRQFEDIEAAKDSKRRMAIQEFERKDADILLWERIEKDKAQYRHLQFLEGLE